MRTKRDRGRQGFTRTSIVPATIKSIDFASSARLPTELWVIIIDMVVDELRHPYLYYTFVTLLQHHTFFSYIRNITKFLASNDWKVIRAVSRKWKALAGEPPYFFTGKAPRGTIPRGMSSVIIYGSLNGAAALEHIAHLGGALTTLTYCPYDHNDDAFATAFVENAWNFPNLKCLRLSLVSATWPFWETIQNEFPNLVSLTLNVYYRVRGAPGRYVLRNLETLDIPNWEGFQLVCPSLKHLALEYSTSDAGCEFVIEHGHQLESLLLPVWPKSIAFPEDFWETICPNIVTFGKDINMTTPSCPPDHPLRHLLLLSEERLTPEIFMAKIGSFPQIPSFHIREEDLIVGTIDQLKRRCQRKGIRLVEIVSGEEVDSSRPLGQVLKRTISRFISSI